MSVFCLGPLWWPPDRQASGREVELQFVELPAPQLAHLRADAEDAYESLEALLFAGEARRFRSTATATREGERVRTSPPGFGHPEIDTHPVVICGDEFVQTREAVKGGWA